MTAKEKLRQTVEELSEAEAQDTLGFIVRRRSDRDALAEPLGEPHDRRARHSAPGGDRRSVA
jgi:hypothetical protein